jgi:hypothetical protein
LQPAVDAGRFPIKRTPGGPVAVSADMFADGHDRLAGVLKYRHDGDWVEAFTRPKVMRYLAKTASTDRARQRDPPAPRQAGRLKLCEARPRGTHGPHLRHS